MSGMWNISSGNIYNNYSISLNIKHNYQSWPGKQLFAHSLVNMVVINKWAGRPFFGCLYKANQSIGSPAS
jgi:hypothetical protein